MRTIGGVEWKEKTIINEQRAFDKTHKRYYLRDSENARIVWELQFSSLIDCFYPS